MRTATLLLFGFLFGCPPQPVTPPPDADAMGPVVPDAAPASDSAPPEPQDASPPAPPQDAAIQDAAPPQDAGSDIVAQACANLVKLTCSEGCGGPDKGCYDGGGSTCYAVLSHMQSSGQTKTNLPCIATAKNQAAVRACAPTWHDACQAQPARK